MKALRSMTYKQLISLKRKIDETIIRRDEKERRDLKKMVEAVRTLSASKPTAGTSDGGHALRGRKLRPKYRNPSDRTQTWAGRGLQPRWLRAELRRGKKLSAFLIK